MNETTLQNVPTVLLLRDSPPPLEKDSVSQFLDWLADRRRIGESFAMIGASLGVSHEAVRGWLSGRINPSATVLLLAARLMREPRELSSGLPNGDVQRAGS